MRDEYNELLLSIIDNAEEGMIYYEPVLKHDVPVDFTFRFVSKPALKYIHGKIDDYIGNRLLDLFPGMRTDGMFDDFKSVFVTGKPSSKEYWYEDDNYKGWYKDYTVRWGGGILVYFSDVSEKVNLYLNLQKALKEKELLLKETHHRVKNNLQITSSLLNLQINNASANPLEALVIAKQRINTIASIHERLYSDGDFRNINLEDFTFDIIRSVSMLSPGKKIDYNVTVADNKVNVSQCVNLGLILNELLINCRKHAFINKDRGIINISLQRDNSFLQMIVKDDGAGLPKDFDFENLSSLGLHLVRALVDQLNGTIEFKSDNGTEVCLRFPEEAA